MSVGPILQSGLNSEYRRDFAMQGVDYPADLASNFLPKGTQQSAIDKMASLITQAAQQCPQAKICAGGYRSDPMILIVSFENLTDISTAKELLLPPVRSRSFRPMCVTVWVPSFSSDTLRTSRIAVASRAILQIS